MVAGASSSMPMTNVPTIVGDYMSTTDGAVKKMDNTIEGVVLFDLGTTKGDPCVAVVESKKPLVNDSSAMRNMFASPKSITFYYFCVNWGQVHLFFLGEGKWIVSDMVNSK